jgi:hypothetical protein
MEDLKKVIKSNPANEIARQDLQKLKHLLVYSKLKPAKQVNSSTNNSSKSSSGNSVTKS